MAQRVIKTSFTASPEDIDKLFACNRISAMIWNKVLTVSKKYALANGGKWAGKTYLQKVLKRTYPLHSQSVQAIIHKYLFARTAARNARAKGYKNKYPWRQKKNYNTKWVDQAFEVDFERHTLSLSLGIWDGKKQQPIIVILPEDTVSKIATTENNYGKDAISEIELCYDNGLQLHIVYDNGIEVEPKTDVAEAVGVDLGEIHAISACATNGSSVIITGRKLRSVNRLRNKKLRSIRRAQAKCNKGSRHWRALQRKKRFVLSKSKHQVAYKTHEITKNFVDWCEENNVRQVYCGNPEGVQRHTSGRKKKNREKNPKKIRTRKVAQKLSNWNFGKVMTFLEYKLEAKGIAFAKTNEAYTSQTCPVCGQRHKTSSRNYRCKCGYSAHRDIVGAHNILSLGMHGRFVKVCDFENKNTKYLRLTA